LKGEIKMRIKKEIKKKIKELQKEYSKLPHYSMFGDDNWKRRDAMLAILNGALEQGEEWVENKLERMTDYYEGNFPEDEVEKLKMDTYDWLLNNIDEI